MKTVFITGAASGIGLATAKRFSADGWYVGLYDINIDEVNALLNGGTFPNACGDFCDVTDKNSIQAALEHFSDKCNGRLDLLVNNAGVLTGGHFEEIESKAHDLMIDINVRGSTHMAQLAFPLLKQTPNSVMVNLCSASSIHGVPLLGVYSASKFYVNGLTEALNIEWAEHDIRVTSVKPPVVKTAMGSAVPDQITKKMAADMIPEYVADSIVVAANGSKVGYWLGTKAKLWGYIDKCLPWFARRRLAGFLTGY